MRKRLTSYLNHLKREKRSTKSDQAKDAISLLSTHPHIVQLILRYCDVPTLCRCLRVSRELYRLAYPMVYNEVVLDLTKIRLTSFKFKRFSLRNIISAVRALRLPSSGPSPEHYPARSLNIDRLIDTRVLTIKAHTVSLWLYEANLPTETRFGPLQPLTGSGMLPLCSLYLHLLDHHNPLRAQKLEVLRLSMQSEGTEGVGPRSKDPWWHYMGMPGDCWLLNVLKPRKIVFKDLRGLPYPYQHRWALRIGDDNGQFDVVFASDGRVIKTGAKNIHPGATSALREFVYVCSPPLPATSDAIEDLGELPTDIYIWPQDPRDNMDRTLNKITYIFWNPHARQKGNKPNTSMEWRGTYLGQGAFTPDFSWFMLELRKLLVMKTKRIVFVGLETLSLGWAKTCKFPMVDGRPPAPIYEDGEDGGEGSDDSSRMVDWIKSFMVWLEETSGSALPAPERVDWEKIEFVTLEKYMREPEARDSFSVEEVNNYLGTKISP